MRLSSLEMSLCKGLLVFLAVFLGGSLAFGRACLLKGDVLGMVVACLFVGIDMWLTIGCLSLIRNGVADISLH